MRIINIFTSVKPYKDVVEVLSEMDKSVEENIIISRDSLPINGCSGKLRFVIPTKPLSGLEYWLWAAKQAKDLIGSDDPKNWLVTEHVVGVSLFFLKYFYRCRPRTMAFLVFPTFEFLLKRGWSADRYSNLSWRQNWFWFKDALRRSVFESVTLLAADGFLANSHDMLRWAKRVVWWKSGYLFPNAVKRLESETGQDSRQNLECTRLLYVGQMQPHKGIAAAIEIWRRIRANGRKAELVLVGPVAKSDDAWLRELVNKDRDLGVRYVGRVPFSDLPAYYRQADAFIFPSFYEGSPRVVQEAMQYGCPVVASRINGNEVIDSGRGVIRFFAPGDAEGATKEVLQLLDEPVRLRDLRFASRQLMDEEFSPSVVADRLWRTYTEFMAMSKP